MDDEKQFSVIIEQLNAKAPEKEFKAALCRIFQKTSACNENQNIYNYAAAGMTFMWTGYNVHVICRIILVEK